MALERLEITDIEQERAQSAEGVPQSPLSPASPEKEDRIAAHDLFTFFTATIMLQNKLFVR